MSRKKIDMSSPVLPETFARVQKEWEKIVEGFDAQRFLYEDPVLVRRCIALNAIMKNVRAGVPFEDLQKMSYEELLQLSYVGSLLQDLEVVLHGSSRPVVSAITKQLQAMLKDLLTPKSTPPIDSRERSVSSLVEGIARVLHPHTKK